MVSDFTYLQSGGKFYYLCIVMDLFSRKIIAWNLSTRHDFNLVKDTFVKAISTRKITRDLIFHSDRGSEYSCDKFRNLLKEYNIRQSFSKKGYPYDNACCESFFKFYKKEDFYKKKFLTFDDLRLSIFSYIDGFYNSRRPHGSINNLTPNKKEDTIM